MPSGQSYCNQLRRKLMHLKRCGYPVEIPLCNKTGALITEYNRIIEGIADGSIVPIKATSKTPEISYQDLCAYVRYQCQHDEIWKDLYQQKKPFNNPSYPVLFETIKFVNGHYRLITGEEIKCNPFHTNIHICQL